MEEPTQVLTAFNAALTFFEKGKGLLKDLTGKLPDGPEKIEAAHDLAQSEEAMQLARVEVARGFKFPLCHRHFPPGIMLDIREDNFSRWKCSTCGDITPKKPTKPMQRGSWVMKGRTDYY